jgi:hypothetical protein
VPGQRAISEGMRKRPQQDSNLRTRLRRVVLFDPLTCGNAWCEGGCGRHRGVAGLPVVTRRPVAGWGASQTCIKPDDSGQFCNGDRT